MYLISDDSQVQCTCLVASTKTAWLTGITMFLQAGQSKQGLTWAYKQLVQQCSPEGCLPVGLRFTGVSAIISRCLG